MRGKVSPWKLILDSGATVHFFCNKYLLQNIRNASNNIKIHCGGKSWDHSCVGDLADELKNLPLPEGEILYTKDGIGNLVSMGRMSKHCRIFMDTSIDNAFYVFNQDNSYVRYAYDEELGLYTMTIDHKEEAINFVTTVTEQEKHFSEIDVKRAKKAR